MANVQYENPVLHGFYPDPSICAVGQDFYLVNSTFSYFPGIPVFHSRDLVHWEQIGNALDRDSQVSLRGNDDHEGIYAPTIRYHQGTYYIIADHETTKNRGGMFVITAQDPRGPWSEPRFIAAADGIDPSLFFYQGKCYFAATHDNSAGPKYPGDKEIYVAEYDLATGQIGDTTPVWQGALRNVVWPEGPHLYHRGDYFYLLIAEAGTSHQHAMTVARSKNIFGPYQGDLDNPILTHRFLGKDFPVKNVGHGDFVQAYTGDWYFVCLGSRQCEGYVNLGRETFLGRVQWEDDWPVLNPGLGRLATHGELNLPSQTVPQLANKLTFETDKADLRTLYLRNPYRDHYVLDQQKQVLKLVSSPKSLATMDSPTFLGIRQSTMTGTFEVAFGEVSLPESQVGLAVYQSHTHFVTFMISEADGQFALTVTKHLDDQETVVETVTCPEMPKKLILKQHGQKLSFGYFDETVGNYRWLATQMATSFLSTEVAGGFVGCVDGVYCYGPEGQGTAEVRSITTSDSF
ncbi:glycoside hydrolase family 43 protein [Levilactobacillus wangkuiensis]|uniref:glycoside hydrolase family 43 protein n=1 Tax=Levilactobacillus wangkuiensis TaxID=2799566 RepID=UPI001944FABA|nr:glycoside hydrolase family 43 protein [Levilactobacillus wangkuiensis]